ncbi:hypothetical protein EJ04DRAFT_538347 [Polyplosphaeria fusca]|uniref:Uncharacterized protein n=1 Tax=Polyplosphaeria fusca TaxID=682080 RepID=A0A9P4QPJ4_9PLEO|nr:hypothetical protein EJ04DRAFT_538347 [Polyplosphaeria fusca]
MRGRSTRTLPKHAEKYLSCVPFSDHRRYPTPSMDSGNPGKRHQIARGIRNVTTDFTVFADDDVYWPSGQRFLPSLLAPFTDPDTGAVGSLQRVPRREPGNWTKFLGALYISRRNFETVGTSNIDGGISCLSGRTQAIRTEIIQSEQFLEAYLGEKWGGHELNPDDDNFITRYVWTSEFKIQVQTDENARVETTLETSFKKYVSQCVRWERSRLRHTITLLKECPRVWRHSFTRS